MGRLSGRTVVIARAAEQAGRLRALLEAEGAAVVEVPTIAIEPPADGDGALREALRDLWDWVVVTSPNGAERAVAAAGGRAAALALRWAVVGPGTADALAALGIHAALVPDRFVAEGLVEAFPDPPAGGGRVLLAQAEAARPVLADGLRERGWDVSTVVAYRTVPVTPPAGGRAGRGGRRRHRVHVRLDGRRLRPRRRRERRAVRRRRHRPGHVRGGRRPRPGGGGRGGPALAGRPRRGHGGGTVVSAPRPVVEALVFDLDGTIADTESVEYDAIRRVWADHGIDYPIERWSQVVGQAWSPSWVTELADEAGADPAASRAAKRAYHDELLAALVLRPGVAALIAAAGDADIPLAIASNSDSGWVEGVLEQLGLLSHFLAVTTIDRVAQGKPHPEPFLAACRRLGARPERSVAFEDSATGVASAVAAGLYTVACPGPLTVGHDVGAADLVVTSLEAVTLASLAAAVADRADEPA